ncbi:MAG: hypothetical protein LBR27_05345 [Bifidobacteriaceae bacterium]|jgi:uroporphyrinogen-III decarboxylase|nr:hypothetical protein [Bifidobacteriaceae bacterium]
MQSRERVVAALNHQTPDTVPVDFGATAVTGMHCRMVAELRRHYGLADKPVRVTDPFQMLGEVDPELQEVIGVDCVPVPSPKNFFGISELEVHEQVTPWGQTVLIAKDIDLTPAADGDVYVHGAGDTNYPPSARMPNQGGFFFDAIERRGEVEDDDDLDVADNLAEFGPLSQADMDYIVAGAKAARATGKAVVLGIPGAGLGDIAYVPGACLPDPKGIRNIADWYMSILTRPEYIEEVFRRQIDIALANVERLWQSVGEDADVAYICGTDFGTQDSQFCSVDTFNELWLPHYQRLTNWIHQHTPWKTMKHSCGCIVPLIPSLIEAGFDILNPVQVNAKGMDPTWLKATYGDQVTFWGGGVDTQRVLPYATPAEIREHVLQQIEIFGAGGGFVFDAVHNVQANVPVANVVAVIDTLREIRGL